VSKKKNRKPVLENVYVSDYAAEGKALARVDGKVIFIESVVPGDTADIMLTKNKKDWAEGRVLTMKGYSENRVEPFCIHFGTCGGCKWQMLPYELQLQYKQQEALQNMRRIGKVEAAEIFPIVGGEHTRDYRNKLEFTFSNKRFLTSDEINSGDGFPMQDALGYHVPRIFDKVLNIFECHLMDPVNNRIRNSIRDYALQHQLSFYDIRQHTGWLRNIIIRYCTTGELMINIVINYDDSEPLRALMEFILKEIPETTTLLYTINPKWNDSIYDLEPKIYYGPGYVTEMLGDFRFMISPKSFFQTNTRQAEKLYSIAGDFAGLTGNEVVYDLYCGTGSIGIFLSRQIRKLVGVELIEEAIIDAKKNSEINGVNHASFFAGDVIDICNDDFFEQHGRPDIIITDPPRAGMHAKLIDKLLDISAPRIVYVSCNSATQARDILLLSEKYRLEKFQPVDMFPHTHHIETVALLTLKTASE